MYARILELFEINSEEGQAEAVFSENFETELKGGQTYFIHKESGIVAFKAEGPGLWSRLEILLAFYPEFEKMYGLRVLAQAETPGLGGRIAEPEFQERFAGVDSVPDIRIVKFAASSNQVDAVAGATKTSAALEAIINTALSGARKAFEK
ncbi:MAG: FMN-binding protein [Clostridia bacterium]